MNEGSSREQATRVALVGNPNCGKTALFNALTGSRQKVANYPGVTVERKEGNFVTPKGRFIRILDLPGTYSLRARSPDEEITRDVVLGKIAGEEIPDIILCIADSTNLRLAVRLALEVHRTGRPMALVLNMFDIAKHRGIDIDLARLSDELKIPVVTSIAVRRGGIDGLLGLLDGQIALPPQASTPCDWTPPDRDDITALQREADRIIAASVKPPAMPHTVTARMDAVLLHPVWGILILLGVLFVMFQAVFTWSEPPMNAIKSGFDFLGAEAGRFLPAGLFRSFVCDGLIAGVGAVIVFLPQILILFFFILLLEDFGYMARAAFLMDKIMGGAGLHGRAFIPLLSSFACAIPAIMATRVIDNKRDRLATILIAPLMTCSARIPVYTLIISAFIPARQVWGGLQLQGLVMFCLYALGILSALGVSFALRRVFWRDVPSEPFLLELPDYKKPDARSVLLGLLQRAKIFLSRAGTTIAAMMMVIWFLASFPEAPKNATEPAIDYSLAASIGKAMEPVFAPIGFNWQINVALIPGMAAREVAVAAFGTVYSIEDEDNGTEVRLSQTLAHQWSLATALALLAWYVFAPQCASTLITIRKETGSSKWMFFSFGYMIALAYIAAFITYHAALALGA
jgi:ferrous iron transport protein B